MKRYVLMVAIISFVYSGLMAQQLLSGGFKVEIINPIGLEISSDLTTNLIFPFAIKSVDRGSSDILAQKARGVENVLQIKAAKEFKQSNLSVITADGRFYSFLVNFSASPRFLTLSFCSDSLASPIRLSGVDLAEDVVAETTEAVLKAGFFLHRSKKSQFMKLRLGGIHFGQRHLWFSFELKNRSLVDFDIEYVKFFVKEKKQARRTAIQVKELTPTPFSPFKTTSSGSPTRFAIVIPAFTLSGNQELRVLVKEKNGGRDLELVLRNGTLLQARSL
ncbi:conjugative transposon protein TraN [Paraflavitalea pollutisoli]|uniref:conjugative transposon protein TraN n=1 Tax=Paraflavitalea pollutisoli TaxID=3034143 RepID=UPI0023ECF4B2|nr:conjugative transposon protein TraN [Paraflavitalea sp. H1-2-19X]